MAFIGVWPRAGSGADTGNSILEPKIIYSFDFQDIRQTLFRLG